MRNDWTVEQLAVLVQVEEALEQAGERAAQLDEAGAQSVLAQARERLLSQLHVPFAHVWLAELSVQEAIVAAQRGMWNLAETLLLRADSLDPRRALEAAEAPPSVVALAHAVAARRSAQPRALSRVRVTETERGAGERAAQAWLDGEPLGAVPADIEASPGPHVLVVKAPGHVPYARLLELGPGRGRPIELALSLSPRERARRKLWESRRTPTAAQAAAQRLSGILGTPVWLFRADEAGTAGASLRCSGRDCEHRAPFLAATRTSREAARAEERTRPFWRSWPFWVCAAGVLGGATLAVGLTQRDAPGQGQRVLRIDPGMLPN